MADIYGLQNEVLLQSGLADAEDESDFDAKLESLRATWEDLVPGFHRWFTCNRSRIFKEFSFSQSERNAVFRVNSTPTGLSLSTSYRRNGLKKKTSPKKSQQWQIPCKSGMIIMSMKAGHCVVWVSIVLRLFMTIFTGTQ